MIEDEITPRHYVSFDVAHAGRLKIQIGRSLLEDSTRPVPQAGALKLDAGPGLEPMPFDFGWVTRGGAIVVHSKRHGVTLIQEPMVEGSKIRWSCIVHPAPAKPATCGTPQQDEHVQPR